MRRKHACGTTLALVLVSVVLLALAPPVYGQQSSDTVNVRAGEVVPFDGLLLTLGQADELLSAVENLEAALAQAQSALFERGQQVSVLGQLVEIRAERVRSLEQELSTQRWVNRILTPIVGVAAFLLGNKSANGFTINFGEGDPSNPAPRR